MTDADLDELERLAAEATPADQITVIRWDHGGGRCYIEGGKATPDHERHLVMDLYDEANREFYVASRTAAPALCAALREAREKSASLHNSLIALSKEWHDASDERDEARENAGTLAAYLRQAEKAGATALDERDEAIAGLDAAKADRDQKDRLLHLASDEIGKLAAMVEERDAQLEQRETEIRALRMTSNE